MIRLIYTKILPTNKFDFKKETDENTREEYEFYMKEISNLRPFNIDIEGFSCTIVYQLQCTMIDGKTGNILTGQKSTKLCNICGVNPTNVNKMEYISNLQCKESGY